MILDVTYLALSKNLEDGVLDLRGVLVETHVLQHHDTREKKSGWVGKTLAGDVWSGTVDGLEDTALITNVSGWSKTETTDQTGAHVGKNVTVQVWHDEDLVVVWKWVGDHLQAGVVQKLGVKLNVWVLLAHLAGGVQEKTVGHFHDGGLVDGADLLATNGLGVLEGESQDTLGSGLGDQLDGLDDSVNDDVLDTRVLSLGVLTDENNVDIVVWGLVSSDGLAWTKVCEEVEGTAKSKIEGDVTLSDWSSERTLECDIVSLNTVDCCIRDHSLAVLELRSNIDWLPLDWDTSGGVNVLDCF